jgi:hypothetical protein
MGMNHERRQAASIDFGDPAFRVRVNGDIGLRVPVGRSAMVIFSGRLIREPAMSEPSKLRLRLLLDHFAAIEDNRAPGG